MSAVSVSVRFPVRAPQISDSRVTHAVLKSKLKSYLFLYLVLFLLSNFPVFNLTIVIRYCTLFYIVISVH